MILYDRLDRMTQHERGTLRNGRIVSSNLQQQWERDQSGNWQNFMRLDADSALAQTREHSRTNHIRHFGRGWATPIHDRVGNMLRMPRPELPSQAQVCRYDAWNRLTLVAAENAPRLEFEYDGLGRRIVKRTATTLSGGEPRHYYYDQSGQVITEMIDQGTKRVLDREYVWDVNRPGRLVCRIRHNVPGQSNAERLYALHDVQGNVAALVDTWGDVQERFLYDPQGNVTFLNPDFSEKPSQASSFDWQHLYGNMQRDDFSGLYIAGSNFYHPALGRMLPTGSISVLPESMLNASAADFPFGSWRASGGMKPFMRWASDQAPWVKVTVGGVAMAGAVVATGAVAAHGNPYAFVMGKQRACAVYRLVHRQVRLT
ncbi:MAG: hypothetical protein WD049_00450 [Candidatus Paceibacterota bacterium]